MSKNHQTPLITFGISGFIGEYDSNSFNRIENSFLTKKNTVQINWTGKNIFITSFQSTDDIGLSPGKYSFNIPKVNKFQGVLYGQHHWNKDLLQPDKSFKSIPERLSKNIITKFIKNKNNALRSINGSNILILYNESSREIFFSRDDLGIIPIYVLKYDSVIYFSSDLRVFEFLKLKEKLILDRQAVAEFLHYLYFPSPNTIYEKIESVLPGHYYYCCNNRSKQIKYTRSRFSLNKKNDSYDKDLSIVIDDFENILKNSLLQSLPKQGRVCVLLSGGKDSSMLLITLSKIFPREKILALTIGFKDKNIDESNDAKILCDFLGVTHQTYIVKNDILFKGIKELAGFQDQPFGDPASLPLYLGLKDLPKDIKFIFDGSGNDYYFGIVKRSFWKNYFIREKFEKYTPKLFKKLILKILELGPHSSKNIGQNWQSPIEDNFNNWSGFNHKQIQELFKENVNMSHNHINKFINEHKNMHWIEILTIFIATIWEPNSCFKKGSYVANHLGLSIVYPFTDRRISDYVKSLPNDLKFKKFKSKILIRKFLEKYAPKEISNKPKGAFIFNILDLFEHNNYQWINYLKKDNSIKIFGDWSDDWIDEIYANFKLKNSNFNQNGLYAIALLATWKIQKYKEEI